MAEELVEIEVEMAKTVTVPNPEGRGKGLTFENRAGMIRIQRLSGTNDTIRYDDLVRAVEALKLPKDA